MRSSVTCRRWMEAECRVPVEPATSRPILLVPKRFLCELPTINAFDFGTELRDDLNLNISQSVRKEDIIRAARSHAHALREWVNRRETMPPRPYDVREDPKLIVTWQRHAADAVREDPIEEATGISTEDDLMNFVHRVVAKFRHWRPTTAGRRPGRPWTRRASWAACRLRTRWSQTRTMSLARASWAPSGPAFMWRAARHHVETPDSPAPVALPAPLPALMA